ncbi:phosphate/phosphite/phosphonate ABC transporter substrate-binding protein [Bdellovibrio sp. 22V]|uniref:phosphate/phosphite/phosphonate ABC transporter substrate-binding protein n=1 Tax=Bdellovibrio TaxID=958 RepID=UPI002543874D|nr:phosphate/phosphite/phosphonate ABC transporter substrate-binding protein [Bdellovibrio sp. 22V]WII72122.1 phosphate/phosphite/phosphonate ABC transporter substrate-binding protein [Bdellovibrio sp. 22V]
MVKKILILFASLSLLSCTDSKELGSKENPVRFALVPGQDSAVLIENGKLLEKWILQQTGVHTKMQVPVSFIAVVEALGSKRVDVAIINTFGYMLAHEKYGVRAKLIGVNHGRSEYWGQIITRDEKIKSLKDLAGKKFAYVDPASTSGYILPAKLLKDEGIKLGEVIFAGKHDSVVTMVYQGRVDAGATYHTPEENGIPQDARRLVKNQFPDVFEKVKILKMTGSIPSDPVVFRKDLPQDLEQKLISALKSFATTPEGAVALKNLYHLTGFKDCSDQDYDKARKILIEMGQNVHLEK